MKRRKIYNYVCQNAGCLNDFKGQLNQKYCSPECKNDVGNAKKRTLSIQRQADEKKLKRNQRILADNYNALDPDKIIPFYILKEQGFDSKLYTRVIKSKDGTLFYYVFDYCYTKLDDGILILKGKK